MPTLKLGSDARDWCEVDLTGDPANCGGCGIACAVNQACVAGVCQ
jgi:hypothetical protein